jgi:hypothetical protein
MFHVKRWIAAALVAVGLAWAAPAFASTSTPLKNVQGSIIPFVSGDTFKVPFLGSSLPVCTDSTPSLATAAATCNVPTTTGSFTGGNCVKVSAAGPPAVFADQGAACGGIKLIQSTTTTGSATSVTISSIPSGYTNLIIYVSGRLSTASGSADQVCAQFNGDTGANYQSDLQFMANGSTSSLGGVSGFSDTSVRLNFLNVNNAPANYPGVFQAEIVNYAGTTFYKTVQSFGSTPQSSSAAGSLFNQWLDGVWKSTAAISSVKVIPCGAGLHFIDGTSVSLYVL